MSCMCNFNSNLISAFRSLDQLLVRIGERNPHFQVVGSHHGYFGPGEEEAVLDDLARDDVGVSPVR